jgi:GNAT superfamily N-acetyltransferase
MEIASLGWHTDVILRQLEGAHVEEHADHLVIRTETNPGYRWGNFLLLGSPVRAGEIDRWIELFQAVFPAADYLALGIDSPAGDPGAIPELRAAGLSIDVDTVLSARALRPPAQGSAPAEFRALESERDWQQALELSILTGEASGGSRYSEFATRQMQAIRGVCELGHGAWFGAFADGELRSNLGIFKALPGVARFQGVETHPDHRRQGLASNLLFAASEWARKALAATQMVVAADPDYVAIDMYNALGFTEHDHKVNLSRA